MIPRTCLLFATAVMTTTARPIPAPEDAYIKSEIQRALPGWVGAGAGLGATLAVPVAVENPLLLGPALTLGPMVGGAAGAVGATGYGIVAGSVKKGM